MEKNKQKQILENLNELKEFFEKELTCEYKNSFQEGYDEGYQEGYDEGYEAGYDDRDNEIDWEDDN